LLLPTTLVVQVVQSIRSLCVLARQLPNEMSSDLDAWRHGSHWPYIYVKFEDHGHSLKKSWVENIFVAVTTDGGRECAINSFVSSTNLNMDIAGVEFFVLKWSVW